VVRVALLVAGQPTFDRFTSGIRQTGANSYEIGAIFTNNMTITMAFDDRPGLSAGGEFNSTKYPTMIDPANKNYRLILPQYVRAPLSELPMNVWSKQ
jgi:hypothetical protein